MTLIQLAHHRPTDEPAELEVNQHIGEVVSFGETDIETVHNIINAFRAIGEDRLLDPFNRRTDCSNRV